LKGLEGAPQKVIAAGEEKIKMITTSGEGQLEDLLKKIK